MLESIQTHEPLLVNSIGHSVGLLLFAGFLVLVLRNRRRGNGARRNLPAVAAALALAWNAGSLVVLASSNATPMLADVVAALSFGLLSMLPAVLLNLSLEGRHRPIWICGYIVSGIAAALHLGELVGEGEPLHQAAIWVIIVGFAPLILVAMIQSRGEPVPPRHAGPRIAVGMCLFLLAISFVHFRPGRVSAAWSGELALHHAGIPLALYVLVQDYRFLLLDAFLRFLANGLVAGGVIVAGVLLNVRFGIIGRAGKSPFLEGVLLLTRVVFGRSDREPAIREIRAAGSKAESEAAFLEKVAAVMARFMRTSDYEVVAAETMPVLDPALITPASAHAGALRVLQTGPWHEVLVPVRFVKGDGAFLLLGRRDGARRYLSEDLQELGRMAAVVVEQVERFRNSEVQRLVSQAELRALQSQINPHFLFNSLNTLYGTIPREAAQARRIVLNLAEIFRYCLKGERTLIPLAEEVGIVRAYLEIEALRLGDKLRTTIEVDQNAERALIPILSIQPLIENAVKHGVAARGGGWVGFRAHSGSRGVRVEVSDDGEGFQAGRIAGTGGGVGLDNVRQRLQLCFGEAAQLEIESSRRGTTVSFLIPASGAAGFARRQVSV
jgi:two-component system, LytTR family, sensor kinase